MASKSLKDIIANGKDTFYSKIPLSTKGYLIGKLKFQCLIRTSALSLVAFLPKLELGLTMIQAEKESPREQVTQRGSKQNLWLVLLHRDSQLANYELWPNQSLFGFQTRDRTKYGLLLPPDEIIPSGDEMWALHQLMAGNVIEEFDADSLDVSGIADSVDDDEDESDGEAAT